MTLLGPSPFPSFVTHFFFVCSFVLLTIFSELHEIEKGIKSVHLGKLCNME